MRAFARIKIVVSRDNGHPFVVKVRVQKFFYAEELSRQGQVCQIPRHDEVIAMLGGDGFERVPNGVFGVLSSPAGKQVKPARQPFV